VTIALLCFAGAAFFAIGDGVLKERNKSGQRCERNAFMALVAFVSKALPHNSSAALAMPFLPSASCRNLDLPPVNLRFLQSHLTKNAFAIAPTHLCGIALEPKE